MMAMHSTWSLVVTAIVFNIVPIFQNHGLSETDAATALTRFFFCIAGMQLLGGILADRLPLNLLMSLGMAGMAGGIGMLILPNSPTVLAYAVFGASQGMMSAVGNTVWVRYYGRAHLGKIRGSIMTATVAGSGVGPFLMGFNYDRLGNYQLSLWVFFAMLVVLAIATLFATRPRVAIERAAALAS